jgi:hypothetical protein
MASRAVFAAPVVVVSVTSASVLKVVVPAIAESSSEVILLFTVSPHVPLSSPVTGKAKPKSDVYDVVMLLRPTHRLGRLNQSARPLNLMNMYCSCLNSVFNIVCCVHVSNLFNTLQK